MTDKLSSHNGKLIHNLPSPSALNILRVFVAFLNEKSLKAIAHVINHEPFRLPSQFKYMEWYFSLKDSINSKLYKRLKSKP